MEASTTPKDETTTNGDGNGRTPATPERKPTRYLIFVQTDEGTWAAQGEEEAGNQDAAKRQALASKDLADLVASDDGVTIAAVPAASFKPTTAKVERTTKVVLS